MSDGVRTLVAVDDNVNKEAVQAVLPAHREIQIVGVVDGLEESWATLQETPTDLLLVACHGYSERALVLIDGAVKQRPERPVVVLLGRGGERIHPPCLRGRRRRHPGAARAAPGGAVRSPEGHRPSPGLHDGGRGHRSSHLRARSQGRHRQDAHHVQPWRLRWRGRGSGWPSSTSTCSSATSGLRSASQPDRTIYDLATSGGIARRREGRRRSSPSTVRTPRPARAGAARSGRVDHDRVPHGALRVADDRHSTS